MSFDSMGQFLFFPTPYPDEILYSVLCRYHSRCGNPSAVRTNLEIWGKHYGKRLFLPDGIKGLADKIPERANLTTEQFIAENTIYPWLKPFLSHKRGVLLFDSLTYENPKIYNLTGLARTHSLSLPYLRYCPQCADDDIVAYGETYWHRAHQLPDITICPKHHIILVDSQYSTNELKNNFFSADSAIANSDHSSFSDIFNHYYGLADDAAWILQNGMNLAGLEHTKELYDGWLSSKDYRHKNGTIKIKALGLDVVQYYGCGILEKFGAYNSGTCVWLKLLFQAKEINCRPLLHLLLMRFLAGSAETFFAGKHQPYKEYQPYGEPPYPCRNVICDHYLQDVIENIEVNNVKGNYRAVFSCPHCGFTYRRKKPLPKEKQYTGQIDVFDYGELWHETLKNLLASQISINKAAKILKCDTRTVVKMGIELDYFPPEQYPKIRTYITHSKTSVTFDIQRDHYRQRWLEIIAANPTITRKELRVMDSKADQWLHMYDSDWLEANSPPSKYGLPKWADSDDEYLEKVKKAVKQVRASPGVPRSLSLAAIGRVAGITKPHIRLVSDYLPKTKAFVEANTETHEQWQKRKILWAVLQMRERGELLTVYKVRHAAIIEDRERKLDEFISELIMNSLY